jgi:hypothetical protein
MKKQTNPKIKLFIEKLDWCFRTGDMELNIKFKIEHQYSDTLTILDENTGEKFIIQISHMKKE